MKKILILFTLLTLTVFTVNSQTILRAQPFARAQVSVGYCEEYQTIYDAMSNPPSDDTATMQNTFVKALVDGVYWNRIELLYVFANGSENDAGINWHNPGTFNLTNPGSTNPVFVAYEGYTGDGNDYFSTGYITATHASAISLNSTTLACYVRTNVDANATVIGVEGGANGLKLKPRISTNMSSVLNSDAAMTSALPVNTSAGFSMVTRRGATETESYKNGTSIGTDTDASTALPADDYVAVLADNDDGTAEEFTTCQISILILMNAVSDSEATAIHNIVEAYMDALGKGVVL